MEAFEAVEQRVELFVLSRPHLLGFDGFKLFGELLLLGRSQPHFGHTKEH